MDDHSGVMMRARASLDESLALETAQLPAHRSGVHVCRPAEIGCLLPVLGRHEQLE